MDFFQETASLDIKNLDMILLVLLSFPNMSEAVKNIFTARKGKAGIIRGLAPDFNTASDQQNYRKTNFLPAFGSLHYNRTSQSPFTFDLRVITTVN